MKAVSCRGGACQRRYLAKPPREFKRRYSHLAREPSISMEKVHSDGNSNCQFAAVTKMVLEYLLQKSRRRPRRKFRIKYNNTAEAVRRFKKGGKWLPNKARSYYNPYCYWQLTRCRHANIIRRLAIFGARHIFPPFRVSAAFQLGSVERKSKMASSSDDEETNSSERFENLCRDLNMDEETSQEAWSSYQKISTNYTLEASLPFVCECLRSLHVCFESQFHRTVHLCGFHRCLAAIRWFWQTHI